MALRKFPKKSLMSLLPFVFQGGRLISQSFDMKYIYRIAWAEAAITSVSSTSKARFQPVVLISVD